MYGTREKGSRVSENDLRNTGLKAQNETKLKMLKFPRLLTPLTSTALADTAIKRLSAAVHGRLPGDTSSNMFFQLKKTSSAGILVQARAPNLGQ